jgi:hypothetical protein
VHLLDDYIKGHYRPLARDGAYQMLLARDTSRSP